MSARVVGGATPTVANTTLRQPESVICLRYFRMRFSDPPLSPHEDSNPEIQDSHPLSSDASMLPVITHFVDKTLRFRRKANGRGGGTSLRSTSLTTKAMKPAMNRLKTTLAKSNETR